MNVAIKSELSQTFQLHMCRIFCVVLLLEMHILSKSEKKDTKKMQKEINCFSYGLSGAQAEKELSISIQFNSIQFSLIPFYSIQIDLIYSTNISIEV